jgi:hypothetical protein
MPKRRVNLCLDDDLWRSVKRLAEASGVSASQYIAQRLQVATEDGEREARVAAVRELGELNLPVAPWEEMEEEIMRARYACDEERSCTPVDSVTL